MSASAQSHRRIAPLTGNSKPTYARASARTQSHTASLINQVSVPTSALVRPTRSRATAPQISPRSMRQLVIAPAMCPPRAHALLPGPPINLPHANALAMLPQVVARRLGPWHIPKILTTMSASRSKAANLSLYHRSAAVIRIMATAPMLPYQTLMQRLAHASASRTLKDARLLYPTSTPRFAAASALERRQTARKTLFSLLRLARATAH